MSPSQSHSCPECGRPVHDPGAWVCGPKCRAILSLVWSRRRRRRHVGDGTLPALDLARKAHVAGIVGGLPGQKVLDDAQRAARGHRGVAPCASPGCPGPATRFGWHPTGEATGSRPRAADIRLLCDAHHRDAALIFLDADERIPHTGPATWARIEAAEPLVPRDDAEFWTRRRARLLTSWPLGNGKTLRDLDDWLAELRSDPDQDWNDALDRLGLPVRRRRRLVRALDDALVAYATTMSPRQRQALGGTGR